MDTDAVAQADYHHRLYQALWDEAAAADAVTAGGMTGLDQMGHFGTAGCDLIAERLAERLAGRLAGQPVTLLELGSGFGGALRYVLGKLDGTLDVRLAIGADLILQHCRVMAAMGSSAPGQAAGTAVCTSVSALGLRSETFDAVFGTGSVSHFPDMKQTLAEAFRVLRPGGLLTFVEEVSLVAGPVSDAFRAYHPPGVFFEASLAERQSQLASCGFCDIEVADLSGWAAALLHKRLLALRVYRQNVDRAYGQEQAAEIAGTLSAARSEIAAGNITPVHVTARRPG